MTDADEKTGTRTGGEGDGSRRLRIGTAVISLLGLTFGATLAVSGSALRWRSDSALGLFNQSGWHYDNLVAGDGKITLALGVLMALGLLVGAVLLNRWFYAVALASAALLLAVSIFEVVTLVTRPGLTGPGHGVYMVLGGGVAGVLCSLGGYLMTSERDVAPRPVPA
ncbi:MAG: hypothetical protein KKF41_08450 [Actinobacteria bacterium]|nr:hypothetical protein [Actinomycetota bacterium]MBU1942871.1 hypothetical protein [Actinomycetota bacterium]MBU2687603.1 hypothetical protein [Actinomycetota bacterium]